MIRIHIPDVLLYVTIDNKVEGKGSALSASETSQHLMNGSSLAFLSANLSHDIEQIKIATSGHPGTEADS